ncbi:pyridoxal phosphate-dependent aminotransferase [bacterium]|nr:pyridoxal phosphate-dependent aminotransferase [bacterium]
MNLNISNRALNTPASPIRKLVPLSMETKKRGIQVFHLNIGQPDIDTPVPFWNAVHSYPHPVLKYGNSEGMPEFIDWLIKYYESINIKVARDELMVTMGGSEAVIFAVLATSNPGENYIAFEPYYTNYNGYSAMGSVEIRPVTMYPEDGYRPPSKEEIVKKIDDKTTGIIVISPNNPTGTVFTREEMEMIGEIAREHNLFIISDEVYREFLYEGEHTSVLDLKGVEDRAILIDSMSKRFSICGARIGCMVCRNKELIKACIRFGQARLCAPTIEQYATKALLEWVEPSYYEEMRAEYKKRRDIAIEELLKIQGVTCKTPSGAFYIMAKFPINDIEDFAQWMLTDFAVDNQTTMIAPGPGFYGTKGLGNSEARIAYVLKEENLRKAIKILAQGIETYNRLKTK